MEFNLATVYAAGAEGYTDYPVYSPAWSALGLIRARPHFWFLLRTVSSAEPETRYGAKRPKTPPTASQRSQRAGSRCLTYCTAISIHFTLPSTAALVDIINRRRVAGRSSPRRCRPDPWAGCLAVNNSLAQIGLDHAALRRWP